MGLDFFLLVSNKKAPFFFLIFHYICYYMDVFWLVPDHIYSKLKFNYKWKLGDRLDMILMSLILQP